jgi:ferric-dicitrate binding protein FerR (iron transport regulator)
MNIEEIEQALHQSLPRGAPTELRAQILDALPRPKRRRPTIAIAALAALWLLVALSHWGGVRADTKFAEGRAPLDMRPPMIAEREDPESAKP